MWWRVLVEVSSSTSSAITDVCQSWRRCRRWPRRRIGHGGRDTLLHQLLSSLFPTRYCLILLILLLFFGMNPCRPHNNVVSAFQQQIHIITPRHTLSSKSYLKTTRRPSSSYHTTATTLYSSDESSEDHPPTGGRLEQSSKSSSAFSSDNTNDKTLLLFDLLVPSMACNVNQMSGTELAYIGDVVFELYIRSKYIWPQKRTSDLQQKVVAIVRGKFFTIYNEYPMRKEKKEGEHLIKFLDKTFKKSE